MEVPQPPAGTHRQCQAQPVRERLEDMQGPRLVALWGVLCLWGPGAGGGPIGLEKVRADTRNLTRTLRTRIQQLQLLPLRVRLGELEPLPGGGEPPQMGLGVMALHLQLLQPLLGRLATAGHRPLAQIANDTENLRSLLSLLAASLGCPPAPTPNPHDPPRPAKAAGFWERPDAAVAEAPHSVARVALASLKGWLEVIGSHLEGTPGC